MLNVSLRSVLLASYLKNGIRQVEPTNNHALIAIAWRIKYSGILKKKTQLLRGLPSDSPEQKKYKLTLPYVIPSGTFSRRKDAGQLTRSGWIVLDFDKLNNPRKLLHRLLKDRKLAPSIVLAFVSPRGNGLKVWVKVDLSFDHKTCYQAVVTHVTAQHPNWCKDGKLDNTPDVSRGCLLCHDSEVYFNKGHEMAPPFPMPIAAWEDMFDETHNAHAFSTTREVTDTNAREVDLASLERWVEAAEQVRDFADKRGTWISLGLAFTSIKEQGRAFFHRVSRTSAKYDEQENEQLFNELLVKSKGKVKLGTFIHLCKETGAVPEGAPSISEAKSAEKTEQELQKVFAGTPCFKDSTFELLPSFLPEVCQLFSHKRERDLALMGLLVPLSGCFPTVQGEYFESTIQANQFVFVAGPAGTGKSAFQVGRKLLWPFHMALKDKWKAYERQSRAHEQAELKGQSPPLPIVPVKPTMRQLFVPSDNSVANIIKTLAENGERGILFDTEADVMSNNFKQDVGDFSPLLRKFSEHEPHQYERKMGGCYELNHPAVSVALSGTPQQVKALIHSVENGLFSRFWFYAYHLPHTFDNPFSSTKRQLNAYLERLADQVAAMIEWVAQYSITVELTPTQQQQFSDTWAKWLAEGVAGFGDDTGSATKRQARACFRLCMLLTLLRHYEEGKSLDDVLYCGDDFTAALEIADVLRQHGLTVYQQLAPRAPAAKERTNNQVKGDQDEQIKALVMQGKGPRPIGRELNLPFTTVAGRIAALGLKK